MRIVRSARVAAAVLGLLVVTGAGGTMGPAISDPVPDRWILAGDQAGPELIALDPVVADWNSAAAVKWRWSPTTALGFSAAEIAAFDGVTDFKLRNTPDGQRIVLTSSGGLAAVISYPDGVRQWAQVLPTSANLHSAELLPDGNVAVTSTNTVTGYVRVYAASQGPNSSVYAQYSLNAQSHGSWWDPIVERLWIIGKQGSGSDDPRIITALAVTGSAESPRLTEDHRKWHELPDIGSHDLTADPNDPNVLLISTDAHTYEFDRTAGANAFTEIPAVSGGLSKVKAVSRQASGQAVQTRPDEYKSPQGPCAAINYWCTDTVDFYGPDTTRTRANAQFYRARVMNPDRNARGDSLQGQVFDREETATGTWSTPVSVDTATGAARISSAALPDGSLHVQTVVPGSGVWDRTRSSSGVWSLATRIDSNGDVIDVSSAALPDGSLHVQTVVPGSGVWDRTRSSSGVWSLATKIDSNGDVADVSAASSSSGVLHVQTLIPGVGVWDRTRNTAGVWSSAVKVDDACKGVGENDPCAAQIAAAVLADGSLHVLQVVPGHGVTDTVRSPAGTWSVPVDIDTNPAVTRTSAAGMPDGTLHVQTVVPGHGLWDRTRSGTGTWSSASQVDASPMIFETYGTAVAGELHIGHAEPQ